MRVWRQTSAHKYTQHCLRAYGWVLYLYENVCISFSPLSQCDVWMLRNLMCAMFVRRFKRVVLLLLFAVEVVVVVVAVVFVVGTLCWMFGSIAMVSLHRCDAIYAVFYSMGFYKRSFSISFALSHSRLFKIRSFVRASRASHARETTKRE